VHRPEFFSQQMLEVCAGKMSVELFLPFYNYQLKGVKFFDFLAFIVKHVEVTEK
jgi:hypothetical protein